MAEQKPKPVWFVPKGDADRVQIALAHRDDVLTITNKGIKVSLSEAADDLNPITVANLDAADPVRRATADEIKELEKGHPTKREGDS